MFEGLPRDIERILVFYHASQKALVSDLLGSNKKCFGRGEYIGFSKKKYFSNFWRIILLLFGTKLGCSQRNQISCIDQYGLAFWREDKKLSNIGNQIPSILMSLLVNPPGY